MSCMNRHSRVMLLNQELFFLLLLLITIQLNDLIDLV